MKKRNITVLAIISLISGVYWSLIYPIYQPFALSLGISMTLLGLIEALGGRMGLFSTLTQLIGGFLADKYGRKIVMITSSLMTMIGLTLYLLAAHFKSASIFIIGSIIIALSLLGIPARSTLTMESASKDKVGLTLSLTMFMNIAPGIIFSPVGGWISQVYDYTMIFITSIIMENACFILMLTLLGETIKKKQVDDKLRELLINLIPKNKDLRKLYFVMTIDTFSWGLGSTLLYGALVKYYGFTNLELGLLSSIFSASWALTQIPAGKIADKYGAKKTLIISELLGAITLVLWLTARDFTTFAISHIIFGASPALWIPAINMITAERAPEEKIASTIGGLSAFRGLISFPAPYIGGFLFDITGYRLPVTLNLTGAVIALIAMIVLL